MAISYSKEAIKGIIKVIENDNYETRFETIEEYREWLLKGLKYSISESGKDDVKTSESGLNKHFVSNNEAESEDAVCTLVWKYINGYYDERCMKCGEYRDGWGATDGDKNF